MYNYRYPRRIYYGLIRQQNRRYRKTLKTLVDSLQQKKIGVPEFDAVSNKSYSRTFRLFWTLLILSSFSIYCYQMYDRVSYFLQNPTTADVYETKIDSFSFIDVSMCYPQNKYTATLIAPDITKLMLSPLFDFVARKEVDINKLWDPKYRYEILQRVEVKSGFYSTKTISWNYTKTWELTPFGTCELTHAKQTLTGQNIYAELSLYFQSPEHPHGDAITAVNFNVNFNFQYGLPFQQNNNLLLYIIYRQYKFLNTKRNPCVTLPEYIRCANQCVKKIYKKNSCWLPYASEKIDERPPCKNSNETSKIVKDNYFTLLGLSPINICNCIRSCTDEDFDPVLTLSIEKGLWKFSVKLGDDYIRIVQEKWLYDVISLLTDFGGNLGLWLGFSLLSLIDFLQKTIQLTKHNNETQKNLEFVQRNPKNKRIQLYFEKHKKSLAKYIEPKERNEKLPILVWLINIAIICSSCYFCYERIKLYLLEPTRTSIHVENDGNVTFPDITVCAAPQSLGTFRYKKKYQTAYKLPKAECQIEYYNLLDLNISADTFWTETFKPYDIEDAKKYDIFPRDVLERQTTRKIATPEGYCNKHSIEPIKFLMYNTFTDYISHGGKKSCWPDVTNIYFSAPGDPIFPPVIQDHVPLESMTAMIMRRIKVHYVSTKTRSCNLNTTEHYNCKQACLHGKVTEQQKCSMPFSIKENTSFCNSAATAKRVRDIFYRVHNSVNVEKECLCLPPCEIITYKIFSYAFNLPIQLGISVIAAIFGSSKTEDIREEFIYPIQALACDIGNALSLTVGYSILTILHSSFNCSFTLIKRTQRRPKLIVIKNLK